MLALHCSDESLLYEKCLLFSKLTIFFSAHFYAMSFNYEFNQKWLDEIHVNSSAVIFSAKKYEEQPNKAWRKLETLLLLKAITLVDLTTLAGDDTFSNVSALVDKVLDGNFCNSIFSDIPKNHEIAFDPSVVASPGGGGWCLLVVQPNFDWD